MKTPPAVSAPVRRGPEAPLIPALPRLPAGSRYLVLAGVLVALAALALPADPGRSRPEWAPLGAVVLLAAGMTAAYLWEVSRPAPPPVEHFVPGLLGVLAVAGFAQLAAGLAAHVAVCAGLGLLVAATLHLDGAALEGRRGRRHTFLSEALLAASLVGAYGAVLALPFSLGARLGWLVVVTALAAFRSLRLGGDRPVPASRALLFSILVAQVVTFFAWALATYLISVSLGVFAVMLLLVWYINAGVIRHTVEETLTRHVVIEYALFGGLLALLLAYSYR